MEPMIDLQTERDTRRAVLEPWYCEGTTKEGRPCRKVLIEMDMSRPSYLRKLCRHCKHVNLFVESYRP